MSFSLKTIQRTAHYREVRNTIGKGLHERYDHILHAELPADFDEVLRRLERASRDRTQRSVTPGR